MMCQRMGLPPTSTMGLGRSEVSSLKRLPTPPARMTAFTADGSSRALVQLTGVAALPMRRARLGAGSADSLVDLHEPVHGAIEVEVLASQCPAPRRRLRIGEQ